MWCQCHQMLAFKILHPKNFNIRRSRREYHNTSSVLRTDELKIGGHLFKKCDSLPISLIQYIEKLLYKYYLFLE